MEAPDGWFWVTKEQLESATTLPAPDGREIPPPEDVIKLGIAAIEHIAAMGRRGD